MPSILDSAHPIYTDVRTFTGQSDHYVPWDINNARRSNLEVMRRMGTPVLLKHRYNIQDVENGVAMESPTMDDIYKQSTYASDQLSYGVGYVSIETQDGEWYDPATGNLYINPVIPDPTYLPAPKYRGYGPGFLTYAILPDRPEDAWKLTQQGTLIRQQTAMAQLPWWPAVGDNDLIITVEIDGNGLITETYERYQMKMTSPISMRGLDRGGQREFDMTAGGNRYLIGQQGECVKIPVGDPTYNVECDR
jgi:hypothetical protein